jgi:hypothetical protein
MVALCSPTGHGVTNCNMGPNEFNTVAHEVIVEIGSLIVMSNVSVLCVIV